MMVGPYPINIYMMKIKIGILKLNYHLTFWGKCIWFHHEAPPIAHFNWLVIIIYIHSIDNLKVGQGLSLIDELTKGWLGRMSVVMCERVGVTRIVGYFSLQLISNQNHLWFLVLVWILWVLVPHHYK